MSHPRFLRLHQETPKLHKARPTDYEHSWHSHNAKSPDANKSKFIHSYHEHIGKCEGYAQDAIKDPGAWGQPDEKGYIAKTIDTQQPVGTKGETAVNVVLRPVKPAELDGIPQNERGTHVFMNAYPVHSPGNTSKTATADGAEPQLQNPPEQSDRRGDGGTEPGSHPQLQYQPEKSGQRPSEEEFQARKADLAKELPEGEWHLPETKASKGKKR